MTFLILSESSLILPNEIIERGPRHFYKNAAALFIIQQLLCRLFEIIYAAFKQFHIKFARTVLI